MGGLRSERAVPMDDFVRVGRASEIPPGDSKVVAVGDREVAVFNVAGTFYAIDNSCPHQGGPLNEGWLNGEIVACPWHGWCFDVRSGKMTLGAFASVDTFEVRVEGETLAVAATPRPEGG